uniref:Scaffolding protein n=1 Tax=viral metagenome TaxID=1070528 RepID=A0A6M3IH66_9ZZZZ
MPDTPAEGVQHDGEPAGNDQAREFFLKTYKTREDAEKGFAEKDATISKLQSERDKAKAEGTKLSEILEKLADAATRKASEAKPQEDQSAQIEKFVADAAEALEDNPKKGIRMILEAVSSWQTQSEQQQSKARETAIKEIAEQLGTSVAEIKRTLKERDPDVVSYGSAAKKLAEAAGLDFEANRDMLIAIAKSNAKTEHPARHDLPGGAEPTRIVGASEAEPLSEAEKQAIGWDTLTKDQRATLVKMWRAR